jgi:hypothetical protein
MGVVKLSQQCERLTRGQDARTTVHKSTRTAISATITMQTDKCPKNCLPPLRSIAILLSFWGKQTQPSSTLLLGSKKVAFSYLAETFERFGKRSYKPL